MKIISQSSFIQWIVLLSGASCLVGWLLGSHSALLAAGAARPPVAAPAWPYPDSLDAVRAAPGFHRVLFENDRVRVLEVTVPPHQREPVHTHRWPSVMYRPAAARGSGRYYDAAGRVLHKFAGQPSPARAHWQAPEGPHAVENTGEVADRFLRVELK